MPRVMFALAGIFGCSGLIADTIGAHILPAVLVDHPEQAHLLDVWQVAARYQIFHALLLCVFAFLSLTRPSFWLKAGAVLVVFAQFAFCGSLYARVAFDDIAIGNFAPAGGIAFMLAWLCLTVAALNKSAQASKNGTF